MHSKLAEHLEGHEAVSLGKLRRARHSQYHDLAQRYAEGKPSGILSFGIKGGKEAGLNSLML